MDSTNPNFDGTLAIDVTGYNTAIDLVWGTNNRFALGSTLGGNYTAASSGRRGQRLSLGHRRRPTCSINSPVLTGAIPFTVGAVTGTPGANLIDNGGQVVLNTPNAIPAARRINGNATVQHWQRRWRPRSGTIYFNSGTLQGNQTGLGVTTTVLLLQPFNITNNIAFSGNALTGIAGPGINSGAFTADAFIAAGQIGQTDLILSGTVNLGSPTAGYRGISIAGTDRIVTMSGQVTGSAAPVLLGGGILKLINATNNYTGSTVISAGTLAWRWRRGPQQLHHRAQQRHGRPARSWPTGTARQPRAR